MEKQKVVEQIRAYLSEERASLTSGAPGDTERARELDRLLTMYRFLPVRPFGPEDVACPAALVELELNGVHAHYFIAPQGGGLVTSIDGRPVQVVTPQSPIGEALLGKKAGDTVEIALRDSVRRYRVVAVL